MLSPDRDEHRAARAIADKLGLTHRQALGQVCVASMGHRVVHRTAIGRARRLPVTT